MASDLDICIPLLYFSKEMLLAQAFGWHLPERPSHFCPQWSPTGNPFTMEQYGMNPYTFPTQAKTPILQILTPS